MRNDSHVHWQLELGEATAVWSNWNNTLVTVELAALLALRTILSFFKVHSFQRLKGSKLEFLQETYSLKVSILVLLFLVPSFVNSVASTTVRF